jgi:hypothetical protein
MSAKPDRTTAMSQLINRVKTELPLYRSDTFVCGPDNNCTGCPKKLLEMVDGELTYWEHQIKLGTTPHFDEIRRFGKMCSSVKRALQRNNLL